MASAGYLMGTTIRFTSGFAVENTPTDPDSVIFRFRAPSNTLQVFTYPADTEIIRGSIGNFYIELQPDEVGTWHYRVEGSGTVNAVAESAFKIAGSQVL